MNPGDSLLVRQLDSKMQGCQLGKMPPRDPCKITGFSGKLVGRNHAVYNLDVTQNQFRWIDAGNRE